MSEKKITEILLERFLLNELSPSDLELVQQSLKNDPELREKLRELEESNKEILLKYDPQVISRKIHQKSIARRIPNERSRNKRGGLLDMTLALSGFAVMIMAVLIIGPGIPQKEENVAEVTRFKGENLKLYIYKKQNNNAIVLSENDRVADGDLLQISYFSSRESYGMIFSLDGRGEVTLHYPLSNRQTPKFQSNKKIFLENSYQLDDAPGFEQFFMISSEKYFKIDDVLKSAEGQKAAFISGKKKEIIFEDSFAVQSLRLRK